MPFQRALEEGGIDFSPPLTEGVGFGVVGVTPARVGSSGVDFSLASAEAEVPPWAPADTELSLLPDPFDFDEGEKIAPMTAAMMTATAPITAGPYRFPGGLGCPPPAPLLMLVPRSTRAHESPAIPP
ncbi:hypothetical protein GCM10010219_33990 [Streptomyces netropsis]|nr:hypothetical protein GCM10010219_33990 [Streptomyces netropsis]